MENSPERKMGSGKLGPGIMLVVPQVQRKNHRCQKKERKKKSCYRPEWVRGEVEP